MAASLYNMLRGPLTVIVDRLLVRQLTRRIGGSSCTCQTVKTSKRLVLLYLRRIGIEDDFGWPALDCLSTETYHQFLYGLLQAVGTPLTANSRF